MLRLVIATTLIAAAGTHASAQDFRRPGADPERPQGTPDSVEPAKNPSASPVNPAEPADAQDLLDRTLLGLDGSSPVPRGVIMPEGTLVNRRTGLILRAPTGESVFVFDPAGEGEQTLRPMVVLPTQSRARMEELSQADGERRYSVSGELTVYRGRNFLLPTTFSRAAEANESGAGAEDISDGDLTRLADDPSVEELIQSLEDRRDMPRGLMNPRMEQGEDDDNRRDRRRGRSLNDEDRVVSAAAISEGKLLMRRPARLVRIEGGVLALATDQGIAQPEGEDAGPLVIMPSQLAQRLENIAGRHGDALSVEVSGRIYGYSGVTYLLPTLVSIEPPSDIRSLH